MCRTLCGNRFRCWRSGARKGKKKRRSRDGSGIVRKQTDGTVARHPQRTGDVGKVASCAEHRRQRANVRPDRLTLSTMSSRFASDLVSGRWVVVPGRSRPLSSYSLASLISCSLFSSHSPGPHFPAYKLDCFHPSYFVSSPA